MKHRLTPEQRKAVAEVHRWFDAQDDDRSARLRKLKKDKDFVTETASLQHDLITLRNKDAKVFLKVFRSLGPLSSLSSSARNKWLRKVTDPASQQIFSDYIRYVARFKVELDFRHDFRPRPFGPPSGIAMHARIEDGHLQWAEEGPEPGEMVYDYLFLDEKMEIIPALAELIGSGGARLLQVDGGGGTSLLQELEYLTYDPSKLAFIIHRGDQPRVYCLIGEAVSTDKLWRDAGKVVTALQKALYGRQKAGRPANLKRRTKAIRLVRSSESPKDQAFAIQPVPKTERDLESRQHYLREVKRHINRSNSKHHR
jgi:hypothetical protein